MQNPFWPASQGQPDVIHLAGLLGRSPNSVAYKLVNFASLDPTLKARGIKGAGNVSKLDIDVWNEFYNHWDILPYESEKLLASAENTTVEQLNHILENELPREGKTREQLIKVRVNQNFFRHSVLSSYNYTCCITGMQQPELLIAGHIRPWGMDESNRLNPSNGIAMNALHDKAFETGLITISTEYKILVSPVLKKQKTPSIESYFLKYDMQDMLLPSKFLPDIEFLKYHNNERFKL